MWHATKCRHNSAAFVALTTSSINIAVLTVKHGFELGWVCLASCGLDVSLFKKSAVNFLIKPSSFLACPLFFKVTINALVIYGVTGYKPDDRAQYYITTMNFSMPGTSNMLSTRPLSVSIQSSPELSLPAPVQTRHKVYRVPTAMSSESKIEQSNALLEQEVPVITPHPHPDNDPYVNSTVLAGGMTDYPQAHPDTIESVRCNRQVENTEKNKGRVKRRLASFLSIPSSWMTRKQCRKAELDTPVEVPNCFCLYPTFLFF